MRQKIHSVYHGASRLPSPLGGLALAIASLGWAWDTLLPQLNGTGQTLGAAIASVLLLALVAKFLLHPQILKEELAHPVIGSVLPTFAMALMVISNSVSQFHLQLSQGLWLTGIVLHLVFLSVFLYHRAREFQLNHMVPSWFVPPIGIIVAAVSYSGTDYQWLAQALLRFGIGCYLVLLPVMLYRLIFCGEIDDAAKPTIAIMAAPASLSLAGYLNITEHPSIMLVALLLGIALLMTILVYMALVKLFTLPFSPGYAAFTFPLVIGATALFKVYDWINHEFGPTDLAMGIKTTAIVELIIASVVVSYVIYRYVRFYSMRTTK
ncbi:TDT family transporter [Shewanella algidipiscicola]|uniref:TDT family transporter n=1 Tax=Shewanella algidipiscicola TaxID=614070 RepID=UPI000D78B0A3|nr:TDT family transporter [Shewanella algidipiscicola]